MPDKPRSTERMFPIINGIVKEIPWSLIAPHEKQAVDNHGQGLKRLAERGGLSPGEAWCVLTDTKLSFSLNWAEVEKAGEKMLREISGAGGRDAE